MIDYLNELRESILDAYTGMIQGLGTSNPMLEAQLPFIFDFLKTVGTDDDTNENTLCSCVGLIGFVPRYPFFLFLKQFFYYSYPFTATCVLRSGQKFCR